MTGAQKYGHGFCRCFLLACIILYAANGISQPDLPDKPDLIRVTVDRSDNGVLIQWEPSTDTTVDMYHLYKLNEEDFTRIFSFSSETYAYKHMTSGLLNLAYTVTAEDTLDGTLSRESLLGDNIHMAITTSVEFDPCTPANLVTWSGYEGWEGELSGYRVFRESPGQGIDTLGLVVDPVTLSFEDREIVVGNTYHYFIEAIHTSGLTSSSAVDTITSLFPKAPGYLSVDYVSVVDRSTIEMQFSADIGGEVNNFRIMRSSQRNGPYSEVKTIRNATQSTHVIEEILPTTVASYQYKVQSIFQPEGCGDPVIISESNLGTSILLTSELHGQTALLSWTPYETYKEGLSGYIIQRKSESGEFLNIHEAAPSTTSWSEPIQAVINGYQQGELHYKILAVGNDSGERDPGISASNIVSLTVPTEIRIPNAFTPGSNDMNYEFKPLIDFAPRKFLMIVFDRAGRKLFETTDPGEGWNGRFHGGNFVDEGVYVYFIQYTDYTGIFRSITGNLTVLYP